MIIVGIDHNRWEPHVSTTLDLLSVGASKGHDCFYVNSTSHESFRYGAMFPSLALRLLNLPFDTTSILERLFQESGIKINSAEKEVYPKRKGCGSSWSKEIFTQVNASASISELKQVGASFGSDIGIASISSISHKWRRIDAPLAWWKVLMHFEMFSFIESYNMSREILSRLDADLLYIFNGRFSRERASVEAARDLGVSVTYHEALSDGSYCASIWQVHDDVGYAQAAREAWDSSSDDDALCVARQWLERRRNRSEESIAKFTRDWECDDNELNKVLSRRAARPLVSFFSSSDDEFFSISHETDRRFDRDQVTAFREVSERLRSRGYVSILRMHPNLASKSRSLSRRWRKALNAFDLVISADSPIDSYKLVRESSLVVTHGSTIGIEAAAMGVPTWTTGPGIYNRLGVGEVLADGAVEPMEGGTTTPVDAQSASEAALKFAFFEAIRFQRPSLVTDEVRGLLFGSPSKLRRFAAVGVVYRRIGLWRELIVGMTRSLCSRRWSS